MTRSFKVILEPPYESLQNVDQLIDEGDNFLMGTSADNGTLEGSSCTDMASLLISIIPKQSIMVKLGQNAVRVFPYKGLWLFSFVHEIQSTIS